MVRAREAALAEAEDHELAATLVKHLAENGITHDTATMASVRAAGDPKSGEASEGKGAYGLSR